MGHWRECHDRGSGQRDRRCIGAGCNSLHTPRDHTPSHWRTVHSTAPRYHLHTGNILRPPGYSGLGLLLLLLLLVPVVELLPSQNGFLPPRLLLLPLLLVTVVVLLLVVRNCWAGLAHVAVHGRQSAPVLVTAAALPMVPVPKDQTAAGHADRGDMQSYRTLGLRSKWVSGNPLRDTPAPWIARDETVPVAIVG